MQASRAIAVQCQKLGNLRHEGDGERTSSANEAGSDCREAASAASMRSCQTGDGQQQIPFCRTDRDRPTDSCGRHFVLKTPFRTAFIANHPAAMKAGGRVQRQNLPVNKIRHFVPNTF